MIGHHASDVCMALPFRAVTLSVFGSGELAGFAWAVIEGNMTKAEEKQAFIQLRAQGVPYSQIAAKLGKSKQTPHCLVTGVRMRNCESQGNRA